MSSAKFWNKFAKSYAKAKPADAPSYHTKLKKTQSYLTPDMTVYEFGCGTGTTALHHAPYVGRYIATDISSAMIDIAKDKAADQDIKNIDFYVSDIECDGFDGVGQIDAILAMSILHLVEDYKAVIDQSYRALDHGGLFITSTICLKDTHGKLQFLLPLMRLAGYAPKTIHFFTQKDFIQIIKDTGFEVEHIWQPKKKAATFIIARKPA